MIDKEELQYWLEEFQDLDPEEIKELLEAVGMDEGDGVKSFSDFNSKNDENANVFPNLNKRKHFDIDD